jgi:hypothetical protein
MSVAPPTALTLLQHPDQHRPERPVLLAVDQKLGEGAALRVGPELADPLGPPEGREHEDVEQLGAGSRPEGVQAGTESAIELVGSHGPEATPPRCRPLSACLSMYVLVG